MISKLYLIPISLLLFGGCRYQEVLENTASQSKPAEASSQPMQIVQATFYGKKDGTKGKKTASGEKFDPNKLTAAHRTLPFGTKVEVENPDNGKKVEVEVNDRGPFSGKSKIDLSYGAAKELGVTKEGRANVKMKVVEKGDRRGDLKDLGQKGMKDLKSSAQADECRPKKNARSPGR